VAEYGVNFHEWQAPPAFNRDGVKTSEARILGWCSEALQEGQAWLKVQRGYGDMRKALDILSGRSGTDLFEYRSRMNTNRLKRNIREIIGALSDIRPLWGYHSDNAAYVGQAEMMNKVVRAIYLQNFFDRDIRKALQFAAATCTGYLRPVYYKHPLADQGDICLKAYGSPSVLPVQMPEDNDLQKAYAVTIIDNDPIWMAHAMWPEFQDRITPTGSRFWYSQETKVPQAGNLFRRIWGKATAQAAGGAELLVEMRYTYINDLSVNMTDASIPMGELGTSWYYTVPYLGQEITGGRDMNGKPVIRKATANDARMYPRRRLIIHTENCVLYDGPSFDWHGMVPLVPFCVDDWPWEGIGFSLARDGYQIQEAINELDRGMMDVNRSRLNVSLAFDTNAVSKREAQRFDPMEPRARIGFDGSMVEKPFQLAIPPEVLMIPPQIPEQRTHLEETMDHQMGLKDIMALSRARAGGAADDVNALMEAQGPIVKDISRTMERSLRDLGQMMKFLILQYYDAARVMRIVGEDGITPETFDYDPTSLIPSHMPGEQVDAPSIYTMSERARKFAKNLNFFITPNSLHAITQMSRQLLYLQLYRAQFPIDSRTVAEALDIPNYGSKPDGNTVHDRWMSEQEEKLEFASRMAQIKDSLPGLQPPPQPGGAPPGPLGANLGGPTHPNEGRPPTAQAPPRIVEKDGGARSTITESR
jgi:hypothetical protein